MRLVVLQPGYLPWLGYFEQLARSDVFVHYDDVQYDKHGWRNRNRIRTAGDPGWAWISVPVRTTGRSGQRIDEVAIDERNPWPRKHWRTLEASYRRAPFWERYAPALESFYERPRSRIVDVALDSTVLLAELLGIERRCLRSSEIPEVPPGSDPTQRLLDLCRHLGADAYYSGKAARDYLDVGRFAAAGIEVEFQDYHHPVYPQCYPGFVSHLSALDLVLNVGPGSRERLLSGAG